MKVTQDDLSYLAGLVDADGCIDITKGGRSEYSCTARLVVVNTNKDIVDWLKNKFGGDITKTRVKNKPNWKPRYTWRIQHKQASNLLAKISGQLKIKQNQANTVFALDYLKDNPSYGGFGEGYSQEMRNAIDLCRAEIKHWNKKGIDGQKGNSPSRELYLQSQFRWQRTGRTVDKARF